MPLFTRGTTQKKGRRMTRRNPRVKISKTISVPPMKETLKAQVTTIAKRATARAIPNKYIGWQVEALTDHNSAISLGDMYPLVQQITKGDEVYQRDGDRVKPKSLVVKGQISLNPDNNPNTYPMYVRVVIAQQKSVRSVSNYSNLDPDHLLKPTFAGASEQAFGGSEPQIAYPLNRDLFRVFMDKVFLIMPTGAATGEARWGAQKRWSYRFKQLPASLTFDEGNGDYANNFAPFVALGYAYTDGTGPDVLTARIQHSVYSQLAFEDA